MARPLPRAIALSTLVALSACMPPSWGAAALLHPHRATVPAAPDLPHEEVSFLGEGGVPLHGWRFRAAVPSRGVTVVWFHGIADTRASGAWIARRLTARGFDVLAYDGRAHGASGGDACTYGVLERRDLSRALDALGIRHAALVGHSLGGAVALQAAAEDRRVEAVVAASAFSDLETVAHERAPWFASDAQVSEALALAEREAGVRAAEASPAAAARLVEVPVLLLHGGRDAETPAAHSRRIRAALRRGELRIVPDAGHDDVLGKAWTGVEAWLTSLFPLAPAVSAAP